MKNICIIIVGLFFCFLFVGRVSAHCEIPCGIYDDEARIKMLYEHVSTIEKSMNQITMLEQKEHHNPNQLVRWVINKEEHANELQEIVTQYFMTQRIKPETENYEKKLKLLHGMLLYAMKCKQTVDLKNADLLKKLIFDFNALYFKVK